MRARLARPGPSITDMRAFAILGLGVQLAAFESVSIPLLTVDACVICAAWADDDLDADTFVNAPEAPT